VYAQGLASFNIPLDMGLSYLVPEMSPLVFNISKWMLADVFQQQQSQLQLLMTVLIVLAMLLMC
jgi:hypothetical protein